MSVSDTPPPTPWWTEVVASGAAIILPFHLFQRKSALQTEKTPPAFVLSKALKAGFFASRDTGLMIGVQRIAQNWIDSNLPAPQTLPEKFSRALLTATIVGTVSTIPLAIFTGRSRGLNVMQSLKTLNSFRQVFASVAMEAGFLFGVAASEPMSQLFREKIADNTAVGYAAPFVSGCMGAAAGHPGDTAFTRLGAKMAVPVNTLGLGFISRVTGVGSWTLFYEGVKNLLGPKKPGVDATPTPSLGTKA